MLPSGRGLSKRNQKEKEEDIRIRCASVLGKVTYTFRIVTTDKHSKVTHGRSPITPKSHAPCTNNSKIILSTLGYNQLPSHMTVYHYQTVVWHPCKLINTDFILYFLFFLREYAVILILNPLSNFVGTGDP